MSNSRFIETFFTAYMLLALLVLVMPTQLSAGERLFTEDFERPDSLFIGNNWREILSGGECSSADPTTGGVKSSGLLFDEGGLKGSKKRINNNPLQREIEQAEYDNRQDKSKISPEATAELREGQLFLQFQENQASQMVQRDVNKRVTHLSYDFSPLYSMGGLDDRAWLGMRVYFLDHRDRILGEIRNFYFNVLFSDLENSDTIHTIVTQGQFDGSMRHTEIDAAKILKEHLTGVDQERIAKTRISLEISSNICGSTAEGYVDNIVLTLADASGLNRFNQEEILAIIQTGAKLFKSNRDEFPSNWIDSIVATYGRKKIAMWLNEIPRDVAARPAELAKLMGDLFQLDGKNAFVVSYGVSILLYHF
ncbi:MAG: hypothetical protein HQL70_09350 [Magnetococcales bacterium]|nr:hypothetical protein [Magnetococcales bacterium]